MRIYYFFGALTADPDAVAEEDADIIVAEGEEILTVGLILVIVILPSILPAIRTTNIPKKKAPTMTIKTFKTLIYHYSITNNNESTIRNGDK